MIIKIEKPCFCGNKDKNEFLEYNGSLGYEAIICKKCGAYSDREKAYNAD